MPYVSAYASDASALWPPCEWPTMTTLSSSAGKSFFSARPESSVECAMSVACAYALGGFFGAPKFA